MTRAELLEEIEFVEGMYGYPRDVVHPASYSINTPDDEITRGAVYTVQCAIGALEEAEAHLVALLKTQEAPSA